MLVVKIRMGNFFHHRVHKIFYLQYIVSTKNFAFFMSKLKKNYFLIFSGLLLQAVASIFIFRNKINNHHVGLLKDLNLFLNQMMCKKITKFKLLNASYVGSFSG